jgi:MoxR-like ATPase
MGLSPRAGMALMQTAKSWAFLHGRDYTLPEDLQQVLPWVIGHRLRSKGDLQQFSNEKLNAFIMEVPIP